MSSSGVPNTSSSRGAQVQFVDGNDDLSSDVSSDEEHHAAELDSDAGDSEDEMKGDVHSRAISPVRRALDDPRAGMRRAAAPVAPPVYSAAQLRIEQMVRAGQSGGEERQGIGWRAYARTVFDDVRTRCFFAVGFSTLLFPLTWGFFGMQLMAAAVIGAFVGFFPVPWLYRRVHVSAPSARRWVREKAAVAVSHAIDYKLKWDAASAWKKWGAVGLTVTGTALIIGLASYLYKRMRRSQRRYRIREAVYHLRNYPEFETIMEVHSGLESLFAILCLCGLATATLKRVVKQYQFWSHSLRMVLVAVLGVVGLARYVRKAKTAELEAVAAVERAADGVDEKKADVKEVEQLEKNAPGVLAFVKENALYGAMAVIAAVALFLLWSRAKAARMLEVDIRSHRRVRLILSKKYGPGFVSQGAEGKWQWISASEAQYPRHFFIVADADELAQLKKLVPDLVRLASHIVTPKRSAPHHECAEAIYVVRKGRSWLYYDEDGKRIEKPSREDLAKAELVFSQRSEFEEFEDDLQIGLQEDEVEFEEYERYMSRMMARGDDDVDLFGADLDDAHEYGDRESSRPSVAADTLKQISEHGLCAARNCKCSAFHTSGFKKRCETQGCAGKCGLYHPAKAAKKPAKGGAAVGGKASRGVTPPVKVECVHGPSCPQYAHLSTSAHAVCNVRCGGQHCVHWKECNPGSGRAESRQRRQKAKANADKASRVESVAPPVPVHGSAGGSKSSLAEASSPAASSRTPAQEALGRRSVVPPNVWSSVFAANVAGPNGAETLGMAFLMRNVLWSAKHTYAYDGETARTYTFTRKDVDGSSQQISRPHAQAVLLAHPDLDLATVRYFGGACPALHPAPESDIIVGAAVLVLGRDRATSVGTVKEITSDGLVCYDAPTVPSWSGAPVLIGGKVAAVHVLGSEVSGEPRNYGVKITPSLLQQLTTPTLPKNL